RYPAGRREEPAPEFQDLGRLATQDREQFVRFHQVFRGLEAESPDGAAVVRLRFYAGLGVEQTAALGLSVSTVDRRWAFARARGLGQDRTRQGLRRQGRGVEGPTRQLTHDPRQEVTAEFVIRRCPGHRDGRGL